MFELLIILGLVALAGGAAALTSSRTAIYLYPPSPQPMPGKSGGTPSVAQMLDFAPFTLTQGERVSVRVLATSGQYPDTVGQSVRDTWGLYAASRGVTRIAGPLSIPTDFSGSGGSEFSAELWQVDAVYANATATFTPKNVADRIAPAMANSQLSPPKLLAAAIVASSFLPDTKIVSVPIGKV